MFFSAVIFLGACGDDNKPVRQQLQTEGSEAPLPVREWYPRPKHMQPTQAYLPPPPGYQRQAVVPPQTYGQGTVIQQPWGVPPQPAYMQPPPVVSYQAPQYVQPQQPWGWPQQQPVMQPQPQQVMPVYQYANRPWGGVTMETDNRQTNTYSETWPPNSYSLQGGAPASGGYTGWGTGQTGAVPFDGYYGNVW